MNSHSCAQEHAVQAAVRTGALDAHLLAHAASCPVCSDVLLIANFLSHDSAAVAQHLDPPEASLVWRKAQARAADLALKRATLPIRIARLSTIALAISTAPWATVELSRHAAWFDNLGLSHLSSSTEPAVAALTAATLLLTAGIVIFAGVSSWYLLREE